LKNNFVLYKGVYKKMKLPFTDLGLLHKQDKEEFMKVFEKCLDNSAFIMGEYITELEKGICEFLNCKYAIGVSSGTDALYIPLLAAGIKEGDEVIVPDLTFVATANAVAYIGAKPIFADVDSETWCIDPEDIKKKITSKTRCIIPVHLYGHPADMDPINEIAKEYGLYVIEDAAEAHGAGYKGRKVGSLGDAGVFSFYGNKIITTGEGGMITTNNKDLYERAKFLKDHAMSKEKRYFHPEIGFNYRLTNIQAALGVAQLERIEELINKKRQIFNWYKEYLSDFDKIILNHEKEWAKNVYWMVCMVLKDDANVKRDELMKRLKDEGIDTRPFFYPISEMPMYVKNLNYNNPFTKHLSERGLNLPSGVNLNNEDAKWICTTIKMILKGV